MAPWTGLSNWVGSVVKDVEKGVEKVVAGSPPELEDISLEKIEKWLLHLDDHFPDKIKLKGVSFDRTNNVSLGFPAEGSDPKADDSDFTVFMPSKLLSVRNAQSAYPTAIQQAFIDVVNQGLKRTDTKSVLIDMATMVPSVWFFNNGGDGSMINSIAKAVDSLDHQKNVVIRLVVGDEDASKREKRGKAENTTWDETKSWDAIKSTYEEIFWSRSTDGRYAPRFKHPNATVYVGYYCPDFQPNDKDADEVTAFLQKVVNSSIITQAGIAAFMGDLKIKEMVDGIIKSPVPSITWNHGKVLAVNGTTLMTGGINYWDNYAATGPHDICDHAVKVQGDAAVSAHKWADYFWGYLIKKSDTDKTSQWRKANLSVAPTWEKGVSIPDSKEFQKRVTDTQKKFDALTVARLGDWYGGMKSIRYPVQAIDAVRDIILNLAWQYFNPTGNPLWDHKFIALAGLLSDDMLTAGQYFEGLGINPTAWASRYARTQAIRCANHSVVICQQMLVDYLQNRDDTYQTLVVATANKKLAAHGVKEQWTGSIWPFELFIALAQALGNMSRSKTPDLHADRPNFQHDSKGIYIVMTTNKIHGSEDTWEDQTPIHEVKKRLKIIMKILPTRYGGVPDEQIDGILDTMLHFKRTGTSKDEPNHDLYSHSKIVCVDRKVMYVGSDNAYPCYNEEHGVWINDQKKISTWLDGFFTDYWAKRCQEPLDL